MTRFTHPIILIGLNEHWPHLDIVNLNNNWALAKTQLDHFNAKIINL